MRWKQPFLGAQSGSGLRDGLRGERPQRDRADEPDALAFGAQLVHHVADELRRAPERDDDRLGVVDEPGLRARFSAFFSIVR